MHACKTKTIWPGYHRENTSIESGSACSDRRDHPQAVESGHERIVPVEGNDTTGVEKPRPFSGRVTRAQELCEIRERLPERVMAHRFQRIRVLRAPRKTLPARYHGRPVPVRDRSAVVHGSGRNHRATFATRSVRKVGSTKRDPER